MKSDEKKNKKSNVSGVKALKLLVAVVERPRLEVFSEALEESEVTMQLFLKGEGTADSKTLAMLGLEDKHKAVILATIRSEKEEEVLDMFASKFAKARNGKGLAFTIALNSLLGVAVYQFLSNQN
ncbi:hypothetical protein GX831_01550 [bacterium]|jgi:hypothetical protein|nr:hypothetical protein [bacterium]